MLKSMIDVNENIFVICRSSIANLSIFEFTEQLNKILLRLHEMKSVLSANKIFFNGLAKNLCIERYGTKFSQVIEEDGIFERLGIWDHLEKIKEGRFDLDNGSYLIFEQTSAF